jgi:hypothetical protein
MRSTLPILGNAASPAHVIVDEAAGQVMHSSVRSTRDTEAGANSMIQSIFSPHQGTVLKIANSRALAPATNGCVSIASVDATGRTFPVTPPTWDATSVEKA